MENLHSKIQESVGILTEFRVLIFPLPLFFYLCLSLPFSLSLFLSPPSVEIYNLKRSEDQRKCQGKKLSTSLKLTSWRISATLNFWLTYIHQAFLLSFLLLSTVLLSPLPFLTPSHIFPPIYPCRSAEPHRSEWGATTPHDSREHAEGRAQGARADPH